MSLIALFVVFAAVQNIDNLVLAAAYGLKNVKISSTSNLLIAALSAIATGSALLVSVVLKREAAHLGFEAVTEAIGRGILLMIGIWTLAGCFGSILFRQLGRARSDLPNRATLPEADTLLTTPETMVAGLALAIDNIAPSFAFGLVDSIRQIPLLSISFLTALTGACSVLAVAVGQSLGRKSYGQLDQLFSARLRPELISGLLFIGIAILPLDVDSLVANFLKQQTAHIAD
jgi:putative Mn2+ efflux pump MntP